MFRKLVYPSAVGLLLLIAAGAQAQNVLFEYWMDVSGTAVSDLTSNGAYPYGPTSSEYRDALKSKVDWADNYGERARAYLVPPADGDYTFWIAGDDSCQLWLSTDDTAANAKMIAQVTGWTPADDWLNTGGGSGGTQMKSAPQSLKAGVKYYIEALHKEGGGGDSVSVAWGGPTIGDGPVLIAPEFFAKFVETRHPAFLPVPASGSVDVTNPLFQWTAGTTAVMHDVYFGTNPNPGAAEFKGRQPFAMYFEVAPLVPGATYYWRVDEIEADGTTIHTGDVWTFTVMPLTAHFPSPYDGALWRSTKLTVSWTAGQNAVSHKVYGGTDKAAITAGDAGALLATQAETSLDASALLQPATTYYWRVDEVDAAGAVVAGPVWTFSTADPEGGAVAEIWTNRYLSGAPKLVKNVPEINFDWGSGTTKGTNSPDPAIGVDNFSIRFSAELNVPVSGKYRIYEASDDGSRTYLNGVQICAGWADRGTTEDASAELDLVAGERYLLVMEYYENGGGATAFLRWSGPGIPKEIIPQGALQIPRSALSPSPVSGATDQPDTPVLSWLPGKGAAQHDVFLSSDQAAIAAGDATALQGRVTEATFTPAATLKWNTVYYWRIDEVLADGTIIPGQVWNFKTADFLVIGLAEKTLNYNNSAEPFLSELVLDTPKDWTVNGTSDFALQFQGNSNHRMKEVEPGKFSVTARSGDIWGKADNFRFVYKQLTGDGAVVAKVYSLVRPGTDWAKAGVMIRQSLDVDASHGMMVVTPNLRRAFQNRPVKGGNSVSAHSAANAITLPLWLKLERAGNVVTAFYSTDGTTWTQQPDTENTGGDKSPNPQTLELGETVYVGFMVTSNATGSTTTAVFSDLSATGQVSEGWTLGDVGPAIPGNDPQPIYVAVEDGAGAMSVLSYPDPVATSIGSWWFWKIPLTELKGVDLKNIAKVHLGVGDPAAPAADGLGTVKFRNVRVVKPSALPPVITSVVRANGQSGDRKPVGKYDGSTAPLATEAGGLKDGNMVFSDRTYPWSKIPAELAGAEYVRMFNSDKNGGETDVTYTVTLSRAAKVLVTADDRIPAEWAAIGSQQAAVDRAVAAFAAAGTFVDTGLDVCIHENDTTDRPMSVYAAELPAGTYVFDSQDSNKNYYTIGAIGGPVDVTAPGDNVAGVPNNGNWPAAEVPANVVDNNVGTKFLHFSGKTDPTGFCVQPFAGASIVTGLTFTSANDAVERDPVKFELSGSNDGINGPWTAIASGDIVDFAGATAWPRKTIGATAITFDNAVPYLFYKVMFPTVRDPTKANSMQIAEVELLGVLAQ